MMIDEDDDVRLSSSYPYTEKREAHLYTFEQGRDAITTVIYESIQVTCMHAQSLEVAESCGIQDLGRFPIKASSPSSASAIAVTKINVSKEGVGLRGREGGPSDIR